jgi:hypothetical protein
MSETIVFETDFSHGQVAIPDHDNIRVPRDPSGNFEIEFLDNVTEPNLPGANPLTVYLPPESTMRSGDTNRYPFTERLPDHELDLYLAPNAPIVEHIFKRYGKQWWTLSKRLQFPIGSYAFSCEVYPDIYSGNHNWAPNPLSGEYRLIAGSTIEPFAQGKFGQWIPLSIEHNHPGGEFKHGLEFRARWGIETVGIFIRRWKVIRIDVPQPTPEIDALKAELAQLRLRIDALTGALNAQRENALAVLDVLRYSARKIADELDAAYDEAQKLGEL